MTTNIKFNQQSQQIKAYEEGQLVYSAYVARINSNGEKTLNDVQAAFDAVTRKASGTPFSFDEINQFESNLNLFKTPSKLDI